MNEIIAIPINSNSYNELETLIAYPIKFKAINVSNFEYYKDQEIDEVGVINESPIKIHLLDVIIYKKSKIELTLEFGLVFFKLIRKIIVVSLILIIYNILLNFLMFLLIPKNFIFLYIDQFSILFILNSLIIGICLWNLID